MTQSHLDQLRDLLTLDELTKRVGMSVRNVRFYTAKRLLPPPIRRGRSGYYSSDHVARLELVRELQGHGFTLAAIEKYLEGIPVDATPEDLALRRAMLAPWQAESMTEMSLAQLQDRAGRTLDAVALETLGALGIVTRVDADRFRVSSTQLSVGLSLLDLGLPAEAAVAAADVYAAHGKAVAEEINELFRTMVWPVYKQAGASSDTIREVVEKLKPLSIASLVSAYEAAMDQTRRERIARRSTQQAAQDDAARSANA